MVIHKQGYEFPIELSVTRIGDPASGCLISFVRDLSPTYVMVHKGKQLNDELIRMSRMAVAKEIAAKLCHEFAQPLTAISNIAAAAKLGLQTYDHPTANTISMIDQVSNGVRRASEILRSFRQATFSENPETTRFLLFSTVEEIVNLLNAATAAPIPASLQIDTMLTLQSDRIKIQQVLLNLIRNASEAIAGLSSVQICISAERLDRSVRLSVSDNGPGVPSSMQPIIFNPVNSLKPGGMGIGLSICRTIVEMHEGRIWLESTEGRGASFCVELPD